MHEYAIIGDGRRWGSVAKTCFDSDACLAVLLGDERYGHRRAGG